MSAVPVIRMSCFQGRMAPEIKVSPLFALLDYLTLYHVLRSDEGILITGVLSFYFVVAMNCQGIRTETEGKGTASGRTKKKPHKNADHVPQSDLLLLIKHTYYC